MPKLYIHLILRVKELMKSTSMVNRRMHQKIIFNRSIITRMNLKQNLGPINLQAIKREIKMNFKTLDPK